MSLAEVAVLLYAAGLLAIAGFYVRLDHRDEERDAEEWMRNNL